MAHLPLDQQTIQNVSKRLKEPSWLTEGRLAALQQHARLSWPHASDEIWRRTNVSQLDPTQGFGLAEAPGLAQSLTVSDEQFRQFIQPMASERLMVRADGVWVDQETPRDILLDDVAHAARTHEPLIRPILEADGLTDAEQKLTSLNAAFHHDDVFLRIPEGFSGRQPIRLVHLCSTGPKRALFPLTVIVVGEGSSVTLIDEYVGLPGTPGSGPHVVNSRIELVLEPRASLQYVRIQHWDAEAREFLLQRAMLQEGAQLTSTNINMGALISKAHVITKLLGSGAASRLYGFAFGRGRQHVDQHTLQDHQAPHTMSDLLFKAALQDASRMVYTGLIRIAKTAKQTDAFQANHNLLLSRNAKAETIPMLEILADDVRCKHGATIGPVDEEQLFYLMCRGLPRESAERLLVMGFVEPIIQQVPFEPLQQRLRGEVEGSLRP